MTKRLYAGYMPIKHVEFKVNIEESQFDKKVEYFLKDSISRIIKEVTLEQISDTFVFTVESMVMKDQSNEFKAFRVTMLK